MSSLINDSEGYPDAIFIGPVMGDMKCGICFEVMKNAQEVCRDAHLFCLSCVNEITNKKCPTCRADISLKPAVAVNRMILQLPVKCYMSDSGCDWRGELGNIETHKTECGFVDVSCSFTDCVTRMQRRHQADHETTCDHRLACCDFCSASMKALSIDEHKTSGCPNRPVVCDKGCGEIFFSSLKSTHAQVCPLEVANCPYRDLMNCSFSCERKDMPLHVADISCHFIGLTTAVMENDQNNKKRKVRRDSLEAENAQLKQRITHLEKKAEPINFSWDIPNFGSNEIYTSFDFNAFGHTMVLTFKKQPAAGVHAGYYGLYLHMRSRFPDKLGFRFTVGRSGTVRNSRSSSKLCAYSADNWTWGQGKIALATNLTRGKHLTANGTLRIKVLVYKTMP